MWAEEQQLVVVESQLAEVKLRLGIQVVSEPLSLQPAQQPPFRRREVAGHSALDRVRDLLGNGNVIDRFRPVEREWIVVVAVVKQVIGVGVSFQVLARVYHGSGRKTGCVNVVGSTSKI